MAAAAVTSTSGCSASEQTKPLVTNESVLDICRKVIESDCIIKTQQKDEPDLTEDQKITILTSLLDTSPSKFLIRFGSLLDANNLKYFTRVENEEVQYHVGLLQRNLSRGGKTVNNRRYRAVQELMAGNEYFTDEAMRERKPLLYEQYIGQYLSEDEKWELDLDAHGGQQDCSLSSFIMNQMKKNVVAERLKQETEAEEGQIEEEDDDEEDEFDEDLPTSFSISSDPLVAGEEKLMLRKEFLHVMQQSFLNGEDKDFNYSSVDQSEDYDDLRALAQDDEDAYFDSEQPFWHGNNQSQPGTDVSRPEEMMNIEHHSERINDQNR